MVKINRRLISLPFPSEPASLFRRNRPPSTLLFIKSSTRLDGELSTQSLTYKDQPVSRSRETIVSSIVIRSLSQFLI